MKRKIALLLAVFMLLPVLAACNDNAKQTEEVSPFRNLKDEELIASVDRLVADFVEEEEPIGISVGILDNGEVKFFNYGVRSEGGAPIDEETQFEIASISKTFAGVLLGTLSADPGLYIEATNSVQQFVPYLALPTYEGEPILWWHLATHTAGLPRLPDNFGNDMNPYENYDAKKLRYYLTEQAHLYNKPGTTYQYSNLGVGFMGYALSYAMRTPYEYLLKARVIWPLGMKNTGIYLTEAQEAARAKPHTMFGTEVTQWDFQALAACGAVKSTAYDMLLYIAANLGQIPVESAYLKQGMADAQKVWYSEPGGVEVGLGFHHAVIGGNRTLWHNGQTGGYCSYLGFTPSTGTGVIVLTNSCINVDNLGVEILELMQYNRG